MLPAKIFATGPAQKLQRPKHLACFKRAWVLAFICLFAASAYGVRLKNSYTTSQAVITLGAIVSEPVAEKISGKIVATLAPGQMFANLGADKVKTALGPVADTLNITGLCVVHRQLQPVDPELIKRHAYLFLQQTYQLDSTAVVVFSNTPQVSIAADAFAIEFALPGQGLGNNIRLNGKLVAAKVSSSFELDVNISRLATAYCLKTPKNRNQLITKADLQPLATRLGLFAPELTDINQIAGCLAARYLGANLPLQKKWVKPAPLVSRGNPVWIDVVGNGFKLGFEATARRDGHLGQYILCTNPRSGKKFQAKVCGPNRASIQIGS